MSTVARISAEINLKDNLSRPLSDAGAKVKRFADRSRDDLGRFSVAARKAWKDFGDELGRVSQRAQMTGLMLTVGLTAPLALAAKKAISAASDLQESFTKTQQVFGTASESIVKFAEDSGAAIGLSKKAALDYASTFGLILQAGGATEEASAQMSTALAKLSADLASFFNVDIEEAALKLKSGLVGETEPLRAFGVLLSENAVKAKAAAMGFKEAGGQLSEQAKVQARYAIILDQTRKAQGDFARTSDGLANQSRILKAEITNLSAEFGEILLPYVKEAVSWVRDLVQKFKALPPETKRTIVAFGAIAAAAGPLLLLFGSIGNAVSGLIAGWGTLSKFGGLLARAFSASGGAVGILRGALAALTGPIGVVIAALTALYLAWKNNFAGIRNIVMGFAQKVEEMLWDVWTNVKSTFDQIWPIIVDAWETVVRESKPIIDFFVRYLHQHWTNMMTAVTVAFRFITDTVNTALAGLKILFGAGWADLSNSMKASLLRMRAVAFTILSNIAQFVVAAFRAMTGWMSRIPGVGDFYDKLIEGAAERVAALRNEAIAAAWLSDRYQDLADAERKIAWPSFPSLSGGTKGGGGGGGGGGGEGGPQGGGTAKAKKAKETEEERLRKQILEETLALQRELNSEKLKASGATLKDVLAMEEYGKKYDEIQTSYRKAKIDAMAALQVFKEEAAERDRLAEEEKRRIDEAIKARDELNKAVLSSAVAYQKEREQLYFTKEEERARWEVTHGGYKKANFLVQMLYIAQARLLDQARAAKEAGEKWVAFWKGLVEKNREWIKDQKEQANERYDEYVKRLTEELLELSGAQEQVLRNNLTEQFKGFGAGAKDAAEAARLVKEKVDEIIGRVRELTDMKEKIAMIREVAKSIEDIFRKSLDDLFENGFKGFFDSVVSGFQDLARQIAAEFLRVQMMKALLWGVGQLFGAGAGSSFGQALKGAASGGSTFAGKPYIVGERGPELFVPNVNGSIVPRDEKGSFAPAMAGGPNITVNLQVPHYSAFRRSEAQLAAQVFARAARARAREGR